MSDQPFNSFRGGRGRGRGVNRGGQRGGNRGGNRGGGFNRGGRGGGRGGFHGNNKQYIEVDYSPEAIESRFAAYYSPSITKDPWAHLTQETIQ